MLHKRKKFEISQKTTKTDNFFQDFGRGFSPQSPQAAPYANAYSVKHIADFPKDFNNPTSRSY